MSTVEDTILCNLNTVGDIVIHVGYSVLCGIQITRPPCTALNTPTVLMISSHVHHDIPYGTEYLHGIQDIPYIYHDVPHGTAHILYGVPTAIATVWLHLRHITNIFGVSNGNDLCNILWLVLNLLSLWRYSWS